MKRAVRILLVEDSPNDVALTLSAFEEAKLTNDIVIVRDGQEAIDYVRRQGAYAAETGPLPSVILLDMKLPKVGGLEVLTELKSDPDLRRIPIVALTASGDGSDVTKSYDLGVNAYVVKPATLDEFAKTLRGVALFWAGVNQAPPPPRKP